MLPNHSFVPRLDFSADDEHVARSPLCRFSFLSLSRETVEPLFFERDRSRRIREMKRDVAVRQFPH